MRPQQQVKMVCHQTKPRQPHRHLFVSFQHQVDKRGEVFILVKDVTPAIAPVQDMVNKTTSRCSGCSWHEHRLTAVVTRVKQNVPFCDSTICEIMLYVGWDQRSAGPPIVRDPKGDILLIRAFWSASWPKRRFQSQFCGGLLLPASVAERCAPSKAVSERLEFGFGFHSVDTASPLSGFQNRSVAEQSIGTAPSGWFQTGPLPVLASINHLRPQGISLHVSQHRQIVVV